MKAEVWTWLELYSQFVLIFFIFSCTCFSYLLIYQSKFILSYFHFWDYLSKHIIALYWIVRLCNNNISKLIKYSYLILALKTEEFINSSVRAKNLYRIHLSIQEIVSALTFCNKYLIFCFCMENEVQTARYEKSLSMPFIRKSVWIPA